MPYDPDADRILVWANTEPQSGYFTTKDGVRSGLITGIMSKWQVDIQNYDNQEYRDSPFSDLDTLTSTAGRVLAAGGGAEFVTIESPPTTDPVPTVTVAADTATTNDDALHIPPRPTLHIETYFQYWDDAGATGSVVYEVPVRLRPVFEVSEQPFTYVS